MNMKSVRKLTSSEKEKYNLSQQSEAFEYFFEKVIEERCDEFENELESDGFEIIDRDYIPVATSIFNFKVVCLKKEDSDVLL